jgi:hypothetical protein
VGDWQGLTSLAADKPKESPADRAGAATATKPDGSRSEGPTSNLRIADVLEAWRAAEQELADMVVGNPARSMLEVKVEDLRALHHRLFAAHVRRKSWHDDSW